MSNRLKISSIVALLVSSLSAQNQYTLENIEVSSSQGTSLEKKDVTDSVSVISKEAIEESRSTTLNEALSKLANITLASNGGVGQSSSLFVRGMSTQRVLVLIDGVRYNNPANVGAAAEISQIMLNDVERIEIIKGAQSGVWGSDASGAVINVITSKVKEGVHTQAGFEYGSFSTAKVNAQSSYATKEYAISLGVNYLNTDGFSSAAPTQEIFGIDGAIKNPDYGKTADELGFEDDAYKNLSLNAKLSYNVTNDDKLFFTLQSIDTEGDFDSGAGFDSAVPNQELTNRFYTLGYSHKDSLNDINLHYNLSTFDKTFELASWSGEGVDTYKYKSEVHEIKLDDKITYMDNSFVRVGASYQKFEQEDITEGVDKDYSAISAFATNYNKFELFENLNTIITESIRFDKYDNFENTFTGKLGIKQFLYKDIYLSSNIGTGYNAPTLGQLYGAFGANPDLKPENSTTFEVTLGNDTLWITGFQNKIEDLIEYVITDYTTYAGGYDQLDGESTFKGFEVGYEDFFFDSLGINGFYTYVETEDADKKELARRPKHQANLNLTYYANESLDVSLFSQYVGERYNQADKQGVQTGEYFLCDLVLNYKIMGTRTLDSVAFYAKINNITDEYYQQVDGYSSPKRSYYLGMNIEF